MEWHIRSHQKKCKQEDKRPRTENERKPKGLSLWYFNIIIIHIKCTNMVLLVVWYAHYYIQHSYRPAIRPLFCYIEYSIDGIGWFFFLLQIRKIIIFFFILCAHSYLITLIQKKTELKTEWIELSWIKKKKSTGNRETHMQKSLYSRRLKCFFVCLFILIQFLSSGTHIVAPKMEYKLFRSKCARAFN